jgi:hypothetical protein
VNLVNYTISQILDPNYSPFNIDSNKMETINARKVSRFSECPTKDFKTQSTTTTPQISNTPKISKFD